MRSLAIVAAAGLSLASLTACQTFDARVQENLPQICHRAEQAHEAFTFATMTGFVPVRLIAREAQAWEVMQELCTSPEKATTADVLVAAVRASAVISEALQEARS